MDAYAGGGKLKLKGAKVSNGRVKKKKSKKSSTSASGPTGTDNGKESAADTASKAQKDVDPIQGGQDQVEDRSTEGSSSGGQQQQGQEDYSVIPAKTEAEKRHDEMRRKRIQERLKRDGVKSHKERVEDLNKYLSRLSEHHDMPKIGPG
ncbi:hypothetical protein BJX99DRAFT_221734 [Aspergillus californicus]